MLRRKPTEPCPRRSVASSSTMQRMEATDIHPQCGLSLPRRRSPSLRWQRWRSSQHKTARRHSPQQQEGAAPAAAGSRAAAPPRPRRGTADARGSQLHRRRSPRASTGSTSPSTRRSRRSLSPTAFSVDQDKTKSTGKEIIVLAPRLHEPVELNTYVTVIGEVVKPDAAEITKRAKAGRPAPPRCSRSIRASR